MEEILFAFAVFYIAYRVAVGVLQAIGGILLLLTLPALWLAHTASAAARSDSGRASALGATARRQIEVDFGRSFSS